MNFILKSNGDTVTVNENQVCYETKQTINGTEYDVLHLSNGEVLIGTKQS